jgi:FKBP-type peptidyl-prolyl cis-trans isomerase FklB
MRLFLYALFCSAFALPPAVLAADTAAPSSEKSKLGYAVGYQVGQDFARSGTEIDPEAVARGVRDALAGKDSALPKGEAVEVLRQAREVNEKSRQARVEAEASKILAQGELYLFENEQKPGVVVAEPGLQYKVLKEGTGKTPTATSTVTVNYRGHRIDGTEFDSSYKRGKPATFALNRVIPGWTKGLQLMKEGGKIELTVHPDLAYGIRRAGPLVPPNSTLIFEVELLEVK